MTRTLIALAVALAAAFRAHPGMAGVDGQSFTRIERGRYLTIVGDCAACHTMPGSGRDFAGGRAIETPFGTLLAPNITPDQSTGIGAWTDEQFVAAVTQGLDPGGVHIYPAMPYTYLTKISREDALAIRAYLNTVPAVWNPVHSNQLPFPFNIRSLMAVWDWLFFTPGQFRPVAGKSEEWNRGAYLAEGLMHCGMCHTPKNIFGGDRTSARLQGYSLQGWFAPNITNDQRRGLGTWSVEQIAAYLKTGHNKVAAASGPMAEEVGRASSLMSEADLRAVAVYLKDQPGQSDDQKPVSDQDPAMKMGQVIYRDECSACHTPNGAGIPGLFPALSGAPTVQSAAPTSMIRVVLQGARSAATQGAPTGPAMPPFDWLLSDEQTAAVITYIRNAWGNAAPAVSAKDVAAARHGLDREGD